MTGDDGQVVVGHQARHLLEVGIGANPLRQIGDLAQPRPGVGAQQIRQRDRTGQPLVGVHHEDPGERVGRDRDIRTRSSASACVAWA